MTADRLPPDQDWTSSFGISRRAVIAGAGVTVGFAAACQPVASTTTLTSSEGLETMNASVTAADGFAVPLYVAHPAGKGPWPTIIVVHEIFGVHEWVRDICRRFAKAGYMAVAPDLFARVGDATRIADIKQLIDTIVAKTSDDQVLSDIEAVGGWIGGHGGAANRIGITGFCWGGRVVWLAAAQTAAIRAGVAFYGRLTGDQPLQPLSLAAKLRAPVLGQYGGKDPGIPQSDVEAMNAALKSAGSPSHITLYPNAQHGFMADYRPSYSEADARQSWAATLDWFGKYLT